MMEMVVRDANPLPQFKVGDRALLNGGTLVTICGIVPSGSFHAPVPPGIHYVVHVRGVLRPGIWHEDDLEPYRTHFEDAFKARSLRRSLARDIRYECEQIAERFTRAITDFDANPTSMAHIADYVQDALTELTGGAEKIRTWLSDHLGEYRNECR